MFTRGADGGVKNTLLPSIKGTVGRSNDEMGETKMKESYNSFIYKPELLLEKVNRLEGTSTRKPH